MMNKTLTGILLAASTLGMPSYAGSNQQQAVTTKMAIEQITKDESRSLETLTMINDYRMIRSDAYLDLDNDGKLEYIKLERVNHFWADSKMLSTYKKENGHYVPSKEIEFECNKYSSVQFVKENDNYQLMVNEKDKLPQVLTMEDSLAKAQRIESEKIEKQKAKHEAYSREVRAEREKAKQEVLKYREQIKQEARLKSNLRNSEVQNNGARNPFLIYSCFCTLGLGALAMYLALNSGRRK